MFVQSQVRLAVAAFALAGAFAMIALVGTPAHASTNESAANAAAKKCGAGKVKVRRSGRSAVCARKCPSGRKHRVTRRGKVRCVRKRTNAPAPPAPPAPNGAPAPPPSDAPPAQSGGPAAGNYSGTTDQDRPVTFTVADGRVTNFEAGVNTWCSTMGNQRVNFDAIANVPPMAIGPDGSFSYTGDENDGNVEIRGTVTGSTATGTVGMNRGDTNYSGGQMYFGSCSASDIPWSAAAG